MDDDRAGVTRRAIDRWTALDTDWQGVLVGVAVVAFVVGLGVDVPW